MNTITLQVAAGTRFQRYNCEDVIVYDEARPGDIAFSDLLKLLDPYGEDVAAPSRYYDKAICAGTFLYYFPIFAVGVL